MFGVNEIKYFQKFQMPINDHFKLSGVLIISRSQSMIKKFYGKTLEKEFNINSI